MKTLYKKALETIAAIDSGVDGKSYEEICRLAGVVDLGYILEGLRLYAEHRKAAEWCEKKARDARGAWEYSLDHGYTHAAATWHRIARVYYYRAAAQYRAARWAYWEDGSIRHLVDEVKARESNCRTTARVLTAAATAQHYI